MNFRLNFTLAIGLVLCFNTLPAYSIKANDLYSTQNFKDEKEIKFEIIEIAQDLDIFEMHSPNKNFMNEKADSITINERMLATNQQKLDNFINSVSDKKNWWEILILSIVILYSFAGYYIIQIQYIYPIVEDYAYFLEKKGYEIYKVQLYSIFNSFSTLFVCLFSASFGRDSLTVSTIYGNLFFLFLCVVPFLVLFTKKQSKCDVWLFSRDGLLLFICLSLILVFLCLPFYGYFGIILMPLYIIFIVLNLKNEFFMHKVFEILHIISEDESFNADLIKQVDKERRICFEDSLLQFVNREDEGLKKRIKRQDGFFQYEKIKQQNIDVHVRNKWSFAIFNIIWALKAKAKKDREQRSNFFFEKLRQINQTDSFSPDIDRSASKLNFEKVDDREELLKQDGNNIDDGTPFSKAAASFRNFKQGSTDRKREESFPTLLTMPEGIWKKIPWIIFMPMILLLYPIPSIHKNANIRKTIWLTVLSVILVLAFTFLVQWSEMIISYKYDAPLCFFGLIINGIGFNISLLVYSYQNYDLNDQVNVYLSFQELVIYQILIVLGLSWTVGGYAVGLTYETIEILSLIIISATFLGLYILNIVVQLIFKCVIGKFYSILFGVLYILSMIVLCILNWIFRQLLIRQKIKVNQCLELYHVKLSFAQIQYL